MVWYMPPSRRRVWFKADTIGETSAEVPLPGLVFSVSPGGWRVFALRGARRPGASTKLYQAPFFNVSSTGVICVGSSQTPKGDARFDPAAWEQAFFESYFSHPNVHGSSLVHYKGGAYPFWQAMLKGKKWRESFPKEVLVERSMTLGRLIAQINQELDRG